MCDPLIICLLSQKNHQMLPEHFHGLPFLWPSVLHGPWRCSERIQATFFPASGIWFSPFSWDFIGLHFLGFFFLPLYPTCAHVGYMCFTVWNDQTMTSTAVYVQTNQFYWFMPFCLLLYLNYLFSWVTILRFWFLYEILVTHKGN